jgi:hypothetical protein
MNKGRTSDTAWVNGKAMAIHRTASGRLSSGKNTPLKNIIGVKNNVK